MKILDENEKLNILECVPVIQGEGQSTGQPMILIRVSGCNLNCQFKGSICDAWETSFNHNNKESKKWSLSEVREVLRENPHIKKVMLTGGEPTLNKILFENIVHICDLEGKFIEMETNGTLYRETESLALELVSISPKLSNSIPMTGSYSPELKREIEEKEVKLHLKNQQLTVESVKKWIQNYNYQLKFVISDEDSIDEAMSFIQAVGADLSKVWFMPEGLSRRQIIMKQQWVYEKCIQLGVNYSGRLHISIYDTQKGV